MSPFEEYLARKLRHYGTKFDTSDLDKRFIPFYNSGQRIKVDFGHGEVRSGTVGITTGWKPTFLLMLRKNSLGSSWTLGFNDRIVAVQRGGRHYYPINECPYGMPDPLKIAAWAVQVVAPYYDRLVSMDVQYTIFPDGFMRFEMPQMLRITDCGTAEQPV